MLKTLSILGLTLFVIGSTLLWRIFNGQISLPKPPDPDDSSYNFEFDPNNLANSKTHIQHFADVLSGKNQQEELKKYKEEEEKRELVLNGSIMCTSIGGVIFVPCLFLYIARLIITISSLLRKFLPGNPGNENNADDTELADIELKNHDTDLSDAPIKPPVQPPQPPTGSGVLPRPGRLNFRQNSGYGNPSTSPEMESLSKTQDSRLKTQDSKLRCMGLQEKNTAGWANATVNDELTPDSIGGTLVEMAQQVAAIREYASSQQDRVKKLQEGYDWNIIRNFCLRIIRCIDNIDNRVKQRSGQKWDAAHLKEVKDELLFALESSGVEQFEPQIHSDYRGQEKYAEAVKDRKACEDSNMTGKIAEVIRPGYQYHIDQDNVKVVRPALVMLFG